MIPAVFPPQSATTGIVMKLLAVVTFVVMAALLKAASVRVPPGELAFFRSFIGLLPIVIWLMWQHDFPSGLRTSRPLGHLSRGLIGTGAMMLNFAALALLSLPEATALGYAAPILSVVFAAMFLGERVRLIRISAVALGMGGVLIILVPDILGHSGRGSNEALGATVALAGATMAALAQIQIRRLTGTETSSAIAFWFMAIASALTLLSLPFGWVMPTPREALLLIGAGLLGGIAQLFMTTAYRNADASILAPFEYSSMLFALLIGYFVFAEIPTLTTLIGAAVVISAGVLIIFRERQLGIAKKRQRGAMTPHG